MVNTLGSEPRNLDSTSNIPSKQECNNNINRKKSHEDRNRLYKNP